MKKIGTLLRVKRVYEKVGVTDGFRVLVDRLWPRGLTKGKAKIDLWLKDVAPSDELRGWFGHDTAKWGEFKKRYFQELRDKSQLVKTLKDNLQKGPITLLYGAKDTKHNNAVVLQEYLNKEHKG